MVGVCFYILCLVGLSVCFKFCFCFLYFVFVSREIACNWLSGDNLGGVERFRKHDQSILCEKFSQYIINHSLRRTKD